MGSRSVITCVFVFFVFAGMVNSANYDWMYNPYTAKQDRSLSVNQSGFNFTASYFMGDGSLLTGIVAQGGSGYNSTSINKTTFQDISGNLNINYTWWDLIWVRHLNLVSAVGNWSADKPNYYNISMVNSTIDDKLTSTVAINGTRSLTSNWNAGNYNISANIFEYKTPPAVCPSGTFMTFFNGTFSVCGTPSGGGSDGTGGWVNTSSITTTNLSVGINVSAVGRQLEVGNDMSIDNNLIKQVDSGIFVGTNLIKEGLFVFNESTIFQKYTNTSLYVTTPNRLAISSDGQYIAVAANDNLHLSNDYGNTWVNYSSTTHNMRDVAMSLDGKYIFGVTSTAAFVNQIIYSQNYGVNFTNTSPIGYVAASTARITSSADGRYSYAVDANNYVFKSSDYGVSYVNVVNLSTSANNMRVTPDGKFVSIGDSTGNFYTSYDYGNSFNSKVIFAGSVRHCISSNGKYIYALRTSGVNPMDISKSADYGNSFSLIKTFSGTDSGLAITCPQNGKNVIVALGSGQILVSNDFGATFNNPINFTVSSPSDVIVSPNGQFIYFSTKIAGQNLIRSVTDSISYADLKLKGNLYSANMYASNTIQGNYSSADGTAGFTGTCTILGLTSITVKNGIITGCT